MDMGEGMGKRLGMYMWTSVRGRRRGKLEVLIS